MAWERCWLELMKGAGGLGKCMRVGVLVAAVMAWAACGAREGAVRSELYFGLGRAGAAEVTAREWAVFVEEEIVPRFPDGFTLMQGEGAWREAGAGRTLREPARILIWIHPGDQESGAKLEAVRQAYRKRFGQESVLRVDQRVRAEF